MPLSEPTPDDPVVHALMVEGRVRIWTLGGETFDVEPPCVAYVPLDANADAELNTGRLRQIVRAVEREDWAGGRSWLRVEAHHRNRWELADALRDAKLNPHEADVSPARRYLSEHDGVRIARATRDALVDLECDSSVPFPLHVQGKAPILRICWGYGLDGPRQQLRLPNLDGADERGKRQAEVDMLVEFRRRMIRDGAHLCSGWNSSKYDQPVVLERSKELGLPADYWERWPWLDLLGCYRAHFQRGESGDERVSFALDAMAHALVGERKVDLRAELGAMGIETDPRAPSVVRVAHDRAPALLDWYNDNDVRLMQVLERRKRFLDLQKALAALCRTTPSDRSLFKSELCDGVMLRVGRKTGVHFRTKPKLDDEQRQAEQAEGAEILEVAPPGVYEGVAVLDFAGMYPSIIDGANISPETLLREEDGYRPHCTTPNGAKFRTDVLGIFPRVIKQLRAKRAEAKARAKLETDPRRQVDVAHESDSIKVVMNAFYGLILGKFSRYYDKACGEGVTTSAKVLMKVLCAEVERRTGVVLGGDTDASTCQPHASMRLPCPKGVEGCWHVDVSEPVRLCQEWARGQRWPRPELLALEHETTFHKFLIAAKRGEDRGAKKRYAGTASYYKGAHLDHPKLEVKGLEVMRSDGERVMRQLLGDVLAAAMLAGASAAEVRGLVDLARGRVLSGAADLEDLVLRQSLSKPLAEYGGGAVAREEPEDFALGDEEEAPRRGGSAPPHVEVARRLEAAGWPMGEGAKVEYVVVGRDRAGKLLCRHPSEWDGKYDAARTWDERVYEPARQVLEVLYPAHDWTALDSGGSSRAQGDLFSAPKSPPPEAPAPEGNVHRDAKPVNVRVGPRATRSDLVRLRIAAARAPGTSPLRVAVEEAGVEVDLPGWWGCDPAALAAQLTWSDQIAMVGV